MSSPQNRQFHFAGRDKDIKIDALVDTPGELARRAGEIGAQIDLRVLRPEPRGHIREDILDLHLGDNVQARLLDADGEYKRLEPPEKKLAVDSQRSLLKEATGWHLVEKV